MVDLNPCQKQTPRQSVQQQSVDTVISLQTPQKRESGFKLVPSQEDLKLFDQHFENDDFKLPSAPKFNW